MASVRPSRDPGASLRVQVAKRRGRPAVLWRIWTGREISVRPCCESQPAGGADRLKILIFGGTGFVGLNIAAALLARGHGVTLFDRVALPAAAKQVFAGHAGALTFVAGDVTDRQSVET